jgi:hypothetical protein
MSYKALTAAATMLLLMSLGAAGSAHAADADSTSPGACKISKRAVYSRSGHPSKSLQLPRFETSETCKLASTRALVLASFTDVTGGEALVGGKAERAIREIEADARTSAEEQINLCVAHTALRNWTDAQVACDAAVNAADQARAKTRSGSPSQLRWADKRVAVAYSNRAVLHWLARDTVAAYADLAHARTIEPKASFVLRNTELTVRVPAQLQLSQASATIG